jgi:hypothetical protein
MRLALTPLTTANLAFARDILNTDTKTKGIGRFAALEKKGAAFSARSARGKLQGSAWRNGEDMDPALLKKQWRGAQEIFEAAVVSGRRLRGFFLHLPAIGLPMKTPAVLIHDPADLANWLLARAVANRQHLRLVKCTRATCGKFGLRTRARKESLYCSAECQSKANADRAMGHKSKRTSREPEKLVELLKR